MNPNFVLSLIVRWLFLMPLVAAVLGAFVLALHHWAIAEVFVLIVAYSFPFSLVFVAGACLLCSFLVTLKYPNLFRSQFDKYVITLGNLVIVCAGLVILFEIFSKLAGHPARDVIFTESKKIEYPKNVLDEWEVGVWRNRTPVCFRATDLGLENSCPGSIDVTFCWEMDPAKDWGVKGADCSLGMKTQRIFSKGETKFQVPWCRSYESTCLATLKVIEAKALKFK
jgi:hypothetical protein